jgi:hypothetical protein
MALPPRTWQDFSLFLLSYYVRDWRSHVFAPVCFTQLLRPTLLPGNLVKAVAWAASSPGVAGVGTTSSLRATRSGIGWWHDT